MPYMLLSQKDKMTFNSMEKQKSKTSQREHILNPGAINLWMLPLQKATEGLMVSKIGLNISEDSQRAFI